MKVVPDGAYRFIGDEEVPTVRKSRDESFVAKLKRPFTVTPVRRRVGADDHRGLIECFCLKYGATAVMLYEAIGCPIGPMQESTYYRRGSFESEFVHFVSYGLIFYLSDLREGLPSRMKLACYTVGFFNEEFRLIGFIELYQGHVVSDIQGSDVIVQDWLKSLPSANPSLLARKDLDDEWISEKYMREDAFSLKKEEPSMQERIKQLTGWKAPEIGVLCSSPAGCVRFAPSIPLSLGEPHSWVSVYGANLLFSGGSHPSIYGFTLFREDGLVKAIGSFTNKGVKCYLRPL